jgi:hypothetical protein
MHFRKTDFSTHFSFLVFSNQSIYFLSFLAIMLQGTKLTELEKCQIDAFRQAGSGLIEIARKVGRSNYVIRNLYKNPEGYGKRSERGEVFPPLADLSPYATGDG